MITLTFVRPIDLFAPLNINGSFYNTTIIKHITWRMNIKVVFFHLGRVWVGTYIPVTRPIPVF